MNVRTSSRVLARKQWKFCKSVCPKVHRSLSPSIRPWWMSKKFTPRKSWGAPPVFWNPGGFAPPIYEGWHRKPTVRQQGAKHKTKHLFITTKFPFKILTRRNPKRPWRAPETSSGFSSPARPLARFKIWNILYSKQRKNATAIGAVRMLDSIPGPYNPRRNADFSPPTRLFSHIEFWCE